MCQHHRLKKLVPPPTLEEISQLLGHKLEEKLQPLRTEINTRFDQIYDAIQVSMGVAYDQSEQKVDKLKNNLEPRIKSLEDKVFAS